MNYQRSINFKYFSRIILILIIGLLLISPFKASAQPTFTGPDVKLGACDFYEICFYTDALRLFALWIIGLIGKLFTWLFTLATGMAQAMITFGTLLLSLPIVQKGFDITRNVANVFFIAGIIFVAFATILRAPYATTKFLKNLIIAALLINFSFFFAGLILDVSNVFTRGFAKNFDAEAIGAAFNPQQIIPAITGLKKQYNGQAWITENIDGSLTYHINHTDAGEAAFSKLLMGTIFAVIMMGLLMVAMLTIAIMTLIRNIWIAALLIIMPIAWGLWVIPTFEGRFKKWWDKFLEWAFYLPIVTFFIWLTTTTSAVMFGSGGAGGTAATDAVKAAITSAFGGSATLGEIFSLLFQMLIIVGFLVAGLKAAKVAGIAISALGLTAAGFVAGRITGAGKKFVRRTAAGVAGGVLKGAGATAKYGVKQAGKIPGVRTGAAIAAGTLLGGPLGGALAGVAGAGTEKKGKRGIAKILQLPGIRRLPGAGRAAGALAKGGEYEKEIEAYIKNNLEPLTKGQKIAAIKSPPMGNVAKAAVVKMAEDEDLLPEIAKDAGLLRTYTAGVKAANPTTEPKDIDLLKDLAALRPSMAPEITGQTADEVRARLKSRQLENMIVDEITPELVNKLSSNQIGIAARGSLEREMKVRNALAKTLEGTSDVLVRLNADIGRFEGAVKGASEQLQKASGAERERISAEVRGGEQQLATLRLQRDNFITDMKEPLTDIAKDAHRKYQRLNQMFGAAEFQAEKAKTGGPGVPPSPGAKA